MYGGRAELPPSAVLAPAALGTERDGAAVRSRVLIGGGEGVAVSVRALEPDGGVGVGRPWRRLGTVRSWLALGTD